MNRDHGMSFHLEVPLDAVGGSRAAQQQSGNQQPGCFPMTLTPKSG
jgi:hypothetical protein